MHAGGPYAESLLARNDIAAIKKKEAARRRQREQQRTCVGPVSTPSDAARCACARAWIKNR